MSRNSRIALVGIVIVGLSCGAVLWWRGQGGGEHGGGEAAVPRVEPPAEPVVAEEERRAAPEVRFSPRDGETAAYRFSVRADAQIDFSAFLPAGAGAAAAGAAGKLQAVRLAATGELNLKYYRAGDGVWEVAATVVNLAYEINGERPAYAGDLGNPFAFRMTERGQLSDLRFARGSETAATGFLQAVLRSLQIVLPERPAQQWRSEEEDMTGQYAATYEIVAERAGPPAEWDIRKRKLEYTTTRAAGLGLSPVLSQATTAVEGAVENAVVARGGAWFASLEGAEQVTQTAAGRMVTSTTMTFSASPVAVDPSLAFPGNFADFQATLQSGRFILAHLQQTDPALDEMGEGLDVEGALTKYQELGSGGNAEAKEGAKRFLVNYLRQHPAAAAELIATLNGGDAGGLDDATQLVVWLLIAKAGLPEIQQAMIAAAENPDYTEKTRIRALAYLSDLEYPTDDLVARLWKHYQDAPSGKRDDVEGELRTMSILSLGVLGSREKLNDAVKAGIGEKLVEGLGGADNPWDQQMALRGIGNYGNAEVLGAVEPYLTDADPGVRGAAYWALRRMDDAQAVGILMRSYKQENDPNVRQEALRTLAVMQPTKDGMEWARWELGATSDPAEQAALAQVLGKSLRQYPANELALRAALAKDPPREVKQTIYLYVAPK